MGPPGVTVGLHRGSLSMGIGCVVYVYRVVGQVVGNLRWVGRLGVQTG